MCGIVGYTGPREAGPILHRGAARASSTAATTRPGSPSSTTAGDLFVEKRAGKLANLQTAHRGPHAARRDRPRPHALGDPRPPERPQRPSPPGLHRRDHRHPQRDHRELPRAARRARGPRPHADLRDRHRGARPPRRGGLRRATSRTPSAPRCARPRAPTRSRCMHRGESDRLVGARKNVPLIVGLATARASSRRDVAAILAHTDRVIFLEEGDVADLRPTGVTITGVDGVRAPARGHDHRLVARGRREGRLRALHAQGDPRAARDACARPSRAG